jgi:hypothetical protein
MLTTKQFNKLSRAKRAVIIAQDVIDQIREKIYKPNHRYNTEVFKNIYSEDGIEQKDASTILKEQPHTIKCEGCARASLFISAVKFKNELTVEEVIDARNGFDYEESTYSENTGTDYLSNEFDKEQQALIETAYEGGRFGEDLLDNMSDRKAKSFNQSLDTALEFHKKASKKWKNWPYKSKRPTKTNYLLTEVCKNIVKNNGTFKP